MMDTHYLTTTTRNTTMPNWCSNDFSVYGKTELVKKFIDDGFVKEDNQWKLSSYLPLPKELENTTYPCERNNGLIQKYGADNWYTWQMHNWGCKWDCTYDGEIGITPQESGNSSADFYFQSPWSQPNLWFDHITNQYPELTFTMYYSETGVDFCGVMHGEGGNVEHEQGEHEYMDEDGGVYHWDSDIEAYIDEDGNEAENQDDIEARNPFQYS